MANIIESNNLVSQYSDNDSLSMLLQSLDLKCAEIQTLDEKHFSINPSLSFGFSSLSIGFSITNTTRRQTFIKIIK